MKNKLIQIATFVLTGLITACATTSHSERESLLSQEIACTQAEEDIAQLEAVLPTRRELAKSTVQSVTPIGVINVAASGSYKDRVAVLTGSITAESFSASV
jgi:DNA-binding helix-hairpin-helix protein with protein kinase domain